MVSIKQDTFDRMHKYCQRGEKHDNFIKRLIDVCLAEEENINISNDILERLLKFTNCSDIDEALNLLMDKYRTIKK